tara:strand:- start:748 stop:1053 length:306 start_codon:yes stop_codon:yes gene_type:complete
MAIQNTISADSSEYGISFNDAYWRIVTIAVSRERGADPKFSVMIDLSAYATSTPTSDTRTVGYLRFDANINDINASSGDAFIDKCYTWVMAQAEMNGSTAV